MCPACPLAPLHSSPVIRSTVNGTVQKINTICLPDGWLLALEVPMDVLTRLKLELLHFSAALCWRDATHRNL